jgi:hypothetical protein
MDQADRDARLGAAVRRLVDLAVEDPVLRDGLAVLVALVRDHLDAGAAVPVAPGAGGSTTVAASDAPEPVAAMAEPLLEESAPGPDGPVPLAREALLALIDQALADRAAAPAPASVPAPSIPAAQAGEADPDAALPGLRDRTALKAELTRAVIVRDSDRTPIPSELLHRSRSAGASAWPADLSGADPAALEHLATAFEAVSDAIDLTLRRGERRDRDRPGFESAVRSLAAVQSALRVQVATLRRWPDEDQVAVFGWLKGITARERIYVERHMRLDDPLDPADIGSVMAGVRGELDQLRDEVDLVETRSRELKRLGYHAGRLIKGKGDDRDLAKVVEATVAAVEAGVPHSSLDLRKHLLPLVPRLSEVDAPKALSLVLRSIEKATSQAAMTRRTASSTTKPAVDGEVAAARELLRGTNVVMVGGEERSEARQALIESFGLAGIDWHTLSDDPSLEELSRAIGRPGVSVVLFLIRWAKHRFGEAREIADRHGVPFVRLPGGYNATSVAHAIMEQASERLRTKGH